MKSDNAIVGAAGDLQKILTPEEWTALTRLLDRGALTVPAREKGFMHLRTVRPAVLFVALALAGSAFGQDAAPSRETGSASASEPKPFEQIVKLWKAQALGGVPPQEDRERDGHLPAVDRRHHRVQGGRTARVGHRGDDEDGRPPAPAAGAAAAPAVAIRPVPAAAPPAAPAPTVPTLPAAPPVPPVVPTVAAPPAVPAAVRPRARSPGSTVRGTVSSGAAPASSCSGPGGNPGSSLSSRARSARLDAADAAKNVVLSLAIIREQFLVCPDDVSSDSGCYEWGVKTADAEFRFRDVAGKREMSSKPLELFTP